MTQPFEILQVTPRYVKRALVGMTKPELKAVDIEAAQVRCTKCAHEWRAARSAGLEILATGIRLKCPGCGSSSAMPFPDLPEAGA
jgi:Zn finger protein HypA/HybF involved in hydrogenase expression